MSFQYTEREKAIMKIYEEKMLEELRKREKRLKIYETIIGAGIAIMIIDIFFL